MSHVQKRSNRSWLSSRLRHFVMLAGLVAYTACSKTPATTCTPGATVACACPGDAKGVQVCTADGTGLGPCACTGAAPAAEKPGPAPAAAVEPAPPPVPAGPLYSYEARLAPLDHVNSKGISLSDVAAVLRQDRARFHAGRGEAEDGTDTVMQEEAGRDAFERLARSSSFAAEVVVAVTTRNPKVKVTVWADRVEAEVLDPGTDEVACVVSDGKVVGIRWDSDFHEAKLLPRWATKGWSLSDHDSTRQLKTPTGALAAEFIHTTGNSIELRGQHCTTAFGVGIGKSLASIKNDNFLKRANCWCDNGPKEALVFLNGDDFGYRLHARCSKPLSCKDDEVHINCAGNWKRDDCIITTFEVGVPAD